MGWAPNIREEIEVMFSALPVPYFLTHGPDQMWWGYSSRLPKDCGIRTRRIGRDPTKLAARLPARREYQRERMRRIRASRPGYCH